MSLVFFCPLCASFRARVLLLPPLLLLFSMFYFLLLVFDRVSHVLRASETGAFPDPPKKEEDFESNISKAWKKEASKAGVVSDNKSSKNMDALTGPGKKLSKGPCNKAKNVKNEDKASKISGPTQDDVASPHEAPNRRPRKEADPSKAG